MFNIYLESFNGNEHLIGSSETEEGDFDVIKSFLDKYDYKSYYYYYYYYTYNSIKEKFVDAGLHREFFYIREE